jgi:adenylate cyclase, class 2
MSLQEIELKLRIHDTPALKEKLPLLGARFVERKTQRDMLFESPVVDFSTLDQALRLRVETRGTETQASFTFKGSPSFTSEGHKVRDEFETPCEFEPMLKIIQALGFWSEFHIEKIRERYELDGLAIEIDELPFGTFLELEGPSERIEEVRQKLGFHDAEPVRESYYHLQKRWNEEQAS